MSPILNPSDTFNQSILLANLPDLSTPHFLAPVISAAAHVTRNRLLIILYSPLFNSGGTSHTGAWDSVQLLLTFVYVQATKVAQEMGKVLMEVDVLLKGLDDESLPSVDSTEVVFLVEGDTIAAPLELPSSVRSIFLQPGPHNTPLSSPATAPGSVHPSCFPVVALGGTFDHLHAGHKILLSMGAWITSEKIIVGITDDILLKSKSNAQILESVAQRTSKVHSFLSLFRPRIEYDIVPIVDVYGPTGWDPNIQALVVSKETLHGAQSIATHREKQALPKLQMFIIDVISSDNPNVDHEDAEMLKATKMSSTFIREWIVKNRNGQE